MCSSHVSSPTLASPSIDLTEIRPSSSDVKWSELELQDEAFPGEYGMVEKKILKGTDISFEISIEGGQWDHRKIFIEHIAADIIAHCPKDEPLVLISLGADRLLTEYVLGKTLIENGFDQISFYLVDPAYRFSEEEILQELKKIRDDFREEMGAVYLKTHKNPLPAEGIRFLTRSPIISKYFPEHANVVVIESLPPYHKTIKDMQQRHIEERKPEDLRAGGVIVPSSEANAVTFIPNLGTNLAGWKFKSIIPFCFVPYGSSYYALDWGCKIQSDGTYRLSFSGEKQYLESLAKESGKPLDFTLEFPTGEAVPFHQWITTASKRVHKALSEQIATMKGDDAQKVLSQAELTMLLEKVNQVFMTYVPCVESYYSADYPLDREAAISYLATHAGHHYRKAFFLGADFKRGYQVRAQQI